MAAASVQNPPAPAESKSSKKRKAKAERTDSPAPAVSLTPEKSPSVSGNDGAQDDSSALDNPYIRELHKNIRNINKRITNASKIEALIAEHKDKSVDELVTAKIINADQKQAVSKKPLLEGQVAQLEEQLAQYLKMDKEYKTKTATAKAETEKSLTEKFDKEKADAVAEATEKAQAETNKVLHDGLLTLSQFLRLAAHRRAEAPESTEDADLALEGVLLSVYSGDESAVDSMQKLYHGTEDTTKSVSGDNLSTTYATVKAMAAAHSAPLFNTEAAAQEPKPEVETTQATEPDPTIVNAGLTEIDEGTATAFTNGHTESSPASAPDTVSANADVADVAANTTEEAQWNKGNDLAASQEWEHVEKPLEPAAEAAGPAEPPAPAAPADLPAEPETGAKATPAVTTTTQPVRPQPQSWADDHPDPVQTQTPPPNNDDGFHPVQHQRRGRPEGGWRGGNRNYHGSRGRGGGYRGDGRGGGRGRGGNRNGMRGGPRRDAVETTS